MHILLVGGTRFVGYLSAWRLLAAGHTLTLFNRGTAPDPFGNRVTRLHGDRTTAAFSKLLAGKQFDAVIDFAAYNAADVQQAIATFANNIGHYLFISTGQVYLVRSPRPKPPARESDYTGAVMPEPLPNTREHKEWSYGIHKRAAEDALLAAPHFPSTRLRIPMVNGERDYYRRIESYLWRILDGGPLLLPDGGREVCRHVYGQDVATALATLVGNSTAHGHAFNFCQQEQPTLAELLRKLADMLGARPAWVPVSTEKLARHNLTPLDISPFSTPWMSHLDPAHAFTTGGLKHQPLDTYLEKIIASFLAHPPADHPTNYAHRSLELQLAAQ